MSDSTSGIRQKGFNESNYPPSEPRGREELAFDSDLLHDPANPKPLDPAAGWDTPGTRVSEA